MRSPALKRAIDLLLGGAALLVALVPMAVIAVVVRVTMGAPVLFRQVRPGRGGELFELCKFRTMLLDDGSRTIPDAERLTRVGRFLRRTSLDELPELINVVRGDMSLVGPRPLLPKYLELYDERQARRHEVRPGLTGLAQVRGRNASSWQARFELDVTYVDTWTIGGDVRIMFDTLRTVFAGEGVSAEGHATMEDFRGNAPDDR